MCYIRHYNKSSNWYHFTRLQTQKLSFARRLIDNGLLHAAIQHFDQALLQFINIIHRLWYTHYCRAYTAINALVALFGVW